MVDSDGGTDVRDRLPAGGHAAATWTIPEDHGGMTSALLHRSRSLARRLGVPVRILTFAPNLDLRRTRRRLRRRRELTRGLTLHNVWQDLRELPDGALEPRPGVEPDASRPRGHRGEVSRRETGPDGVVRTYVFRRDRSLVAVEEERDRRSTVRTFTRSGRPGTEWPSLRALYRSWLTTVLPDDPTYVVVDSKSLIRFFADRPGAHVRTLHRVHGAHLATDAADAHGRVVGRRGRTLDKLETFDAVVVLTAAQGRDLTERLGPGVRTYVVPNATDLPAVRSVAGRDPARGMMLARLVPNKRVDHAIDAVAAARRRSGRPISLDVYGAGPEAAALAERAAQVPGVRLRGHVAGAASRLAEASFLLLTSTSEGMGLVLGEAMARGCLPIAYDIRYGPSDVITHGVDGFLVPPGDVDALAATIEHVSGLDDATLRPMRLAAMRAARRFDDDHVTAGWVDVMADVARRHGPTTA